MKTEGKPGRSWITRRKWWLAGAIAVALGVTVVAPFVFIHFIEGTPPAPLSLSAPSAAVSPSAGAATAAVPKSFAGVYQIAGGSQAQYRVAETLFGQSATAVGSTSTISGSMTVRAESIEVASFSVPLATVHSNISQRDDQFDHRIMDIADYPTAAFTLTRPIVLSDPPAVGVIVNQTATGNLTMHGVTKSVTFSLQLEYTGSEIKASGSIPITFADWKIANPSGGPAQVGDSGTLGFLLVLSP